MPWKYQGDQAHSTWLAVKVTCHYPVCPSVVTGTIHSAGPEPGRKTEPPGPEEAEI